MSVYCLISNDQIIKNNRVVHYTSDVSFINCDNDSKGIGFKLNNEGAFFWSDSQPCIEEANKFNSLTSFSYDNVKIILGKSQNNFSGFSVDYENEKIILFSSRFSRSQLFFIQNEKGLFFSSNFKELLAYSNKIINLIVSDDPKNIVKSVGSGATVFNNSTKHDVIKILKKNKILNKIPKRMIKYLNNINPQNITMKKNSTENVIFDNKSFLNNLLEYLR